MTSKNRWLVGCMAWLMLLLAACGTAADQESQSVRVAQVLGAPIDLESSDGRHLRLSDAAVEYRGPALDPVWVAQLAVTSLEVSFISITAAEAQEYEPFAAVVAEASTMMEQLLSIEGGDFTQLILPKVSLQD